MSGLIAGRPSGVHAVGPREEKSATGNSGEPPVHRRHREGPPRVARPVGRPPQARDALIAGGEDHDRPRGLHRVEEGPQLRIARRDAVETGEAPAVDDHVRDVEDGLGITVGIEHPLERFDGVGDRGLDAAAPIDRPGCDPVGAGGHADTVAGRAAADRARDMRAVTGTAGIERRAVLAGPRIEPRPLRMPRVLRPQASPPAGQGGMGRIDAGIDDPHEDVGAVVAQRPGRRRVDGRDAGFDHRSSALASGRWTHLTGEHRLGDRMNTPDRQVG